MKLATKILSAVSALAIAMSASAVGLCGALSDKNVVSADENVNMEWGAVEIGGGGFVSGIITGKKAMYARTDVGGAYKYNYETERWEQLLANLNEADRGMLSVDAMAVDPTDDDTVYMLCGCGYFSDARTEIFKTTDGGKTFTRTDVTDMIQVHANGYGRQCGEAIAIDPDNTDVIYCGGDATAGASGLIKSTDGGKTWDYVKGYDDLSLFKCTDVNWPTWTNHKVRTTANEYDKSANGVAFVKIKDSKVYVGTSINDGENVHVASVKDDKFKLLSDKLPTNSFPSRITEDADGRLLICYVGGLSFQGTGGGIFRYDPKSDTVEDISPTENSFGCCISLPNDADTLIATTCGVWSGQNWDKGVTCYGEWLYRSTDGGKTWDTIYPGKMGEWYYDKDAQEMKQAQLYKYTNGGGYDWIYGKAIHWSGTIVTDPTDPETAWVVSGNGVFRWDRIWTDDPEAVFHPNGIEEVVALDMVSVPGGSVYSAIGDYDGFEHFDVKVSGNQYVPNIGSTGAIAYCPQNPDVMVRIAEKNNEKGHGLYTLDGGKTWTEMASPDGGKAAITQLEDGSYRFFKSGKDDGAVSYSDDLGKTWNKIDDIQTTYGSKTTYFLVEPKKPNVVYAYATYYNSSWGYSKPEAEFSDAHYTLYVSTDYGKTFKGTDIAMYDQCDSAGRIAYLGEDNLILAAGWYGLYNVTNGGKDVEKLDVHYCKTVGYGAPEKEGGVNTLFMYGKPAKDDAEGIYRSTDGGKSWVCINTQKLYGGTGNGNFLVGDMNEFGKVYMSTVGCGIVYGALSDKPQPDVVGTTVPKETTTSNGDKTTETTTTAVTTTDKKDDPTEDTTVPKEKPIAPTGEIDESKVKYGDVTCNGAIEVNDVVRLNVYILTGEGLDATAFKNADCNCDGEAGLDDSGMIVDCIANIIKESDLGPQS